MDSYVSTVSMSGTATFSRKNAAGASYMIEGTPPQERLKRAKLAEAAASANVAYLVLTPFNSVPKVSFDNIKFGKCAIRKIVFQNPAEKPVQVTINKFPKAETGFEIDYDSFELGAKEEATLRIGWVPQQGGNSREKINVKYGTKSTQVILVGSCEAPPMKPSRIYRTQLQMSKIKKSKKTVDTKPSIPLPENPVQRLKGQSPPKRSMYKSENKENGSDVFQTPSVPPLAPFKMETAKNCPKNVFKDVDTNQMNNLKHETYIKNSSFSSSTPLNKGSGSGMFLEDLSVIESKEKNSCKELNFDEQPVIRRETFVAMPTEIKPPQAEQVFLRRETYSIDSPKPSNLNEKIKEAMSPINVSDILEKYMDLDQTISAPKTPNVPSIVVTDTANQVSKTPEISDCTDNVTCKEISQPEQATVLINKVDKSCKESASIATETLSNVTQLVRHALDECKDQFKDDEEFDSFVAENGNKELEEEAEAVFNNLNNYHEKIYGATKIIQDLIKKMLERQKIERLNREKKNLRMKKRNQAAIKIQTYWRMYRCKKEYKKKMDSIIILQSFARQIIAKKQLNTLKNIKEAIIKKEFESAVAIQSFWRMKSQREKFIESRCAVIKIQSLARRIIAQNRVKLIKQRREESSIKIQSWWRKVVCQRRFQQMKSWVLILQAFARQIKAKKITEQLKEEKRLDILKRNNNATLIQSFFKGHMARKSFLEKKFACIVIQKNFRGFVARKNYLEVLEIREFAATKIQSFVRQCLAKKRLEELKLVQRQNFSATIIQAWWKKLQYQKKYQEKKSAAIVIQSFARQIKAKIILQELKEEKRQHLILVNSSATTIQSWLKMYVAMKQYNQLKRSTILIQSLARRNLVRNNYLKMLEEREQAAIKIQSFVRKVYAIRLLKNLKLQNRQKLAAISIQSWYRKIVCQRIYNQKRSSVIILQAFARQIIAKNILRTLKEENFNEMNLKATKIQSFYKMYSARKNYIAQKKAATTIQNWHRSCMARKNYLQMLENRELAAIKIQTFWRKFNLEKSYKAKRVAALIIQCHIRRFQAKQMLRHLQRERFVLLNKSATKIQSFYRMYLERVKFAKTKKAVIAIQSHARRFICQNKYFAMVQKRQEAAITIQSYYKMYQARKEFQTLKKSVVMIQKHSRGFIARNKYQSILENRNVAATKIQTFVRQVFAKKQLNELKMIKLENISATIIQAWWKKIQCQKKYQEKKNAAIVIQSFARQIKSKIILHELKEQRNQYLALINSSATKIQSWMKMYVAMKQYNQLKRSIILIQSYVRRNIAHAKYIAMIERRERSAIVIQSFVRVLFAKKELKQLKLEKLEKENNCAIKIQSFWRMTKAKNEYLMLQNSALKIQSYCRMYLAKKRFNTRVEMNNSATKLQAWWKMVICQREYSKQQKSVIVIQSFFRQILAKKEVAHLKNEYKIKMSNATIIQSYWRMRSCRKNYIQLRKSAIVIQAVYRKHLAQKLLKQMRLEKELADKELLLKKQKAALIIQTNWRCHIAKNVLHQLKEQKRQQQLQKHCVLIQSVVRRYLAKNYVDKLKSSILLVQSRRRMLPHRNEFLKHKRAATCIQKWVRGYLVRLAFKVENHNIREAMIPHIEVNEDLHQKIEEARTRVKEAQENAVEELKLCNITALALDFLYKKKDMGRLIKAVMDLDMSTRLSSFCCDRLIANGNACFLILVDFLNSCNRSVPHMELISSILDMMINLAKYKPAFDIMVESSCCEQIITSVINITIRYNDKSSEIFTKGCSVLWSLSHSESAKKVLMESRYYQRLVEIRSGYHKKHLKLVEAKKRREKFSLHKEDSQNKEVKRTKKPKSLSMEPCWKINNSHIRHHNEPSIACNVLLKFLTS